MTVKTDNILPIYVTGHGFRKKSLSRYMPEDGDVSSDEYIDAMKNMRFNTIVSVFDTCHSGGLATAMRRNNSAITITDTDAGNRPDCRYFARTFRGSFADCCCDLNGDAKCRSMRSITSPKPNTGNMTKNHGQTGTMLHQKEWPKFCLH